MRNKSKRIASKGLELACFVAERLGSFPDHTGTFAFDWEPGDGELDGGSNISGGGGGGGAWDEGQEGEVRQCVNTPRKKIYAWCCAFQDKGYL